MLRTTHLQFKFIVKINSFNDFYQNELKLRIYKIIGHIFVLK